MNRNLQILKIRSTGGRTVSLDSLASLPTKEVFALKNYTIFAITNLGGHTYLAAYDLSSPELDLYEFTDTSSWLQKAGSISVGTGWDLLEFALLANVTYAMLYQAKNGHFSFFSLSADLKSTERFNYNRSHAPAATQGFSTVKPFVLAGGIVILAYSIDSGAMSMYNLTSLAESPAGVAPLQARVAGGFQWANGWTRFAFFQLGGGNFFLKTNIVYPNVNIDHVLDIPANGTSEVATQMTLKDAQSLSLVVPFTLDFGDPYFVAYRADGVTILYRIHTDGLGWTEVGNANLPSAASAILIAPAGNEQFCLVI